MKIFWLLFILLSSCRPYLIDGAETKEEKWRMCSLPSFSGPKKSLVSKGWSYWSDYIPEISSLSGSVDINTEMGPVTGNNNEVYAAMATVRYSVVTNCVESGTITFDPQFFSDNKLYLYAARHEVGHFLGLGHANSPWCVMFKTNIEKDYVCSSSYKILLDKYGD